MTSKATTSTTVLYVDPDTPVQAAFARVLADNPQVTVVAAETIDDALEAIDEQRISVVVADGELGEGSIELLRQVRQLFPDVSSVLLSPDPERDRRTILEELDGSIDVLSKPWDADALRDAVHDALTRTSLSNEERDLVDHGGVTLKQLERAKRIQTRLHRDRALGDVMLELGLIDEERLEAVARVRRSRMSVMELLVDESAIGEEELTAYAAAREERPGATDRELLVGGGLVSEDAYLQALCSKLSIPFGDPEVGLVDSTLVDRTSTRYLSKHCALPVYRIDGHLAIYVSDPLDRRLLTELERIFGMPLSVRCSTSKKIAESIRMLERLRGEQTDNDGHAIQYREIRDSSEEGDTGEEAVQIVDYLLARSIHVSASDLHIEPQANRVRVRMRVDGVLTHLTDLPIEFAPRIVSRVKILAGADIAEKRLHQDGKVFVKVDGREIDIRVSTYVTVHGETIVMRLLDRNRGVLPLDDVGFTERAYAALTDVVLEASSGLVTVVGPTGSGKTSTLYSFVDHANDPGEKVITAEDPVEFVIDGLIQCSVNNKTGPTFHESLRAIVRQDPDTIVVGEIRDPETVGMALESALTGHKVFSTFHTEDAVGAFVRMLEMGVEPFLVASTVSAVVAQRLVRRICTKCVRPTDPLPSELRFLGIERSELRGATFLGGEGCGSCNGTGYKGRRAIHEVLLPNDEFRETVMRRASAKEMREQARKLPEFLTLQEDGVLKACNGETTLAEVIQNAPRDTAARPLSHLQTHDHGGRSGR